MTPGIDWAAPWFEPWRKVGEPIEAALATGLAQHEALNACGGPLRFVAQVALPARVAYEQFIFDTGQCPVRPGRHDFFNGLVWLRLPRTKRRLNALQAEAIAARGIGSSRGPLRDAITVFDENGLLLDAPELLWAALLARQWQRLFVELRPLWRQARVLVFGHALLEKLANPRKDLTGHVWRTNSPLASLAQADDWLVRECTPERLAAKPFAPLPVLGIPGWCPANENFSFYEDSLVFRPGRGPRPAQEASAQAGQSGA